MKTLLIASNIEQLKWIANKGLYNFSCNQAKTIEALKYVVDNDIGSKRLAAIEIMDGVVLQ